MSGAACRCLPSQRTCLDRVINHPRNQFTLPTRDKRSVLLPLAIRSSLYSCTRKNCDQVTHNDFFKAPGAMGLPPSTFTIPGFFPYSVPYSLQVKLNKDAFLNASNKI
uniref:COesterase domain-containing protein n=1 Tax=Steinernema glaseri TaxID=37863 RepID=A0A1I7YYW1_9BILA